MRTATDITGRKIEFGCMSCDISEHKLVPPGGMIYEDGFVTLAADVEVPIEGFIILAPKRHVLGLNDLTSKERYHITEVLNEAIKALKELGIAETVNVVQEEHRHMHIWILPNHEWMKECRCGLKEIRELFKLAKNISAKEGVYKVLYAAQRLKTYFKESDFKVDE